MNASVPAAYRKIKGGGICTRIYRPSDNPLEIIRGLRNAYGRLTPTEKRTLKQLGASHETPGSPIELYFRSPTKIFILVTKHPPAYTVDQIVGKAKTATEQCGLFPQALLKFNAFLDEHKDWANMKYYFGEAYKNLITTSTGICVRGTIANIQELEDDDDSLGTITDAMSIMQMSNNANAQHVRSNVSVLHQELAMMRDMLQQANNVQLQV